MLHFTEKTGVQKDAGHFSNGVTVLGHIQPGFCSITSGELLMAALSKSPHMLISDVMQNSTKEPLNKIK